MYYRFQINCRPRLEPKKNLEPFCKIQVFSTKLYGRTIFYEFLVLTTVHVQQHKAELDDDSDMNLKISIRV